MYNLLGETYGTPPDPDDNDIIRFMEIMGGFLVVTLCVALLLGPIAEAAQVLRGG